MNYTFEVVCNSCGKAYSISCNKDDLIKWKNGEGLIQDVLHYLTKDQRELLISGTCGECFDKLFPPDEE